MGSDIAESFRFPNRIRAGLRSHAFRQAHQPRPSERSRSPAPHAEPLATLRRPGRRASAARRLLGGGKPRDPPRWRLCPASCPGRPACALWPSAAFACSRGRAARGLPIKRPFERLPAAWPASSPLQTSCAMLVAWSDFEGDVDRAARKFPAQPSWSRSSVRQLRLSPDDGQRQAAEPACAGASAGCGGLSACRRADRRGGKRLGRTARRAALPACGGRGRVQALQRGVDPETDGDHLNHIHVDLGPWSLCSM